MAADDDARKRELELARSCSAESACYTVLVKSHAHLRCGCSRLLRQTRWQLGLYCLLQLGTSCTEPSYRDTPDGNVPRVVSEDAGAPVTGKRDSEDDRARPPEGERPRDAQIESGSDQPLPPLPEAMRDPDAQVALPDAQPAALPSAQDPSDAMTMQRGDAEPAWWSRLRTNYAVRIRFFGRDRALGDAAGFKHEIIMLAKVSVDQESGRVAMQAQRCLDHGVVTGPGGLTDAFHWMYPERLPLQNFELLWRDGKVQTEAAARPIGYDPTAPAGCKPGDKLPSRPEQAWLSGGTCKCGTEPLPTLPSDCRVTDPDGDKAPGISVQHVGLNDGIEGARVKDSSQIVDGVLSQDGRIRGSFIENYDYLGLSCGSSPCLHNDILVCPLSLNPVQFEPITDNSPDGVPWDCATIVQQAEAGRFFTSEMFTFPSGC